MEYDPSIEVIINKYPMSKTIGTTPRVKSLLPQAIQEREQLLKMVIDKLYKDLGRNNMTNHYIIEEIVKSYFEKQKINDQVLRTMRNQVVAALKSSKNCSSISANRSLLENSLIMNQNKNQSESISLKSGISQNQVPSEYLPPIRNSSVSRDSTKTKSSNKSRMRSEEESDTSSVCGKSVYYVDGNGEDQWASLVKYDSQLYKKQLQLNKIREQQFRKKMKLELDQQIKEKKQKEDKAKKENEAYGQLQAQIYQNFLKQQEQKNKEKEQRLGLQKKMRDMQIKQVKKRKKDDVNRQNDFDRQLVTKIQEQLAIEHQQTEQRRRKQKQRQRIIQEQSQIAHQNKKKQKKEQREEEIRQQAEYNYLQQQLQEQKQRQRKQREDKIKQIMLAFATTVGKQQKDLKALEDSKMMDYIKKQLKRKQKQEQGKKMKQEEQKKQLKQFFDYQVQEKKLKKTNQENINRLQAEIWKQDEQNFKIHETKRLDYMNEMKKRHNQVLEMQIQQKERKNGKSMNHLELLYNKSKIKDLGKSNDNVKKGVIPG